MAHLSTGRSTLWKDRNGGKIPKFGDGHKGLVSPLVVRQAHHERGGAQGEGAGVRGCVGIGRGSCFRRNDERGKGRALTLTLSQRERGDSL